MSLGGHSRVLAAIIDALDALSIRYFVGGSFASIVFGELRTTQDVDIVVELEARHVAALIEQLSSEFFVDEDFVRDAIQRRSSCNLIHRTRRSAQVVQTAARTTRTPLSHYRTPPSPRQPTCCPASHQGISPETPHPRQTAPPQRPGSPITRADHAPNQLPPPSGGARATANSGTSNGSPIARSTRSIELGSWIAASSRRTPPQFGHVKISTRNTRRNSSAHV
ncbi:MAG: hypothetical protein ACI90M_004704 [Candidatus Azotimanducaceae bacterium]|jgi:hypothetical protein